MADFGVAPWRNSRMPFLMSRILRGKRIRALGALIMMAGCGNPETGTFSAAGSEKAAAEKGIKGPGPGATNAPVKPSFVRTKKGLVPRGQDSVAPSPD
jgi:hypothetical protein